MRNSRRSWLRAWPLLLVLAMLATPVRGQNVTATVTGKVTDSTGESVKGATVVATNQKTGVEYPTRSNDAGIYTISGLSTGAYVVRAELTGFKGLHTNSITLEVGQTARVDLKLEVGTVTESIEVVGVNPILQTESAVVGEVITGSTATALPLNGRNFAQLTLLLPGAVHHDPQSFTTPGNLNGGRPFVNGQREQGNNFMLDGLDSNEAQDNLISYNPSPEALAEIRVETNSYSAEFGNVAGAVVNSVIKSGTNEFHGNAFEFLRNDAFDANSWLNNHTPGATKAQLSQHIFGATVGGPIRKNKVFFFADYQGTRIDTPGSATASLAPAEWRRGDFSSLLASGVVITDPLTGQPFPGNIIPTGRFSPAARALLADGTNYPLPTGPGPRNNYAHDQLGTTRVHQGDLKIDANLSPNDNVFVRLSFVDTDVRNGATPVFPLAMGTSTQRPSHGVAVNWTRTLSSSTVNELRLGFNRTKNNQVFVDTGGVGDYNQTLGIAGSQAIPGVSGLLIAGLDTIGSPSPNSAATDNVYQVSEKLSLARGRHFFTTGVQVLHTTMQRSYASNNGVLGAMLFTGRFTGQGFSDFLLDQVSFKGIGGLTPWEQVQNRIGAYFQDDFKASSSLTLNLGVRWEYFSPLVEKNDHQVNYDLTTGQALFAGEIPAGACAGIPAGCAKGDNRGLYDPYRKGFAPRLGFAWSANDKTVVRGGYGIVQYQEGAGANNRLSQNVPFVPVDAAATFTARPGTMATGFQDVVGGDTGTVGAGSIRVYQRDLRPQFTQQWNFFVERQLGAGLSAELGYVGVKATHVLEFKDSNQPLPGQGDPSTWADAELRRPLRAILPNVSSIRTTGSEGTSDYHGLQVGMRQRRTKGLEFLASYTLSRSMQDNRGFYEGGWGGTAPHQIVSPGNGYVDNRNPRADRGPSFFDAKHNFTFSANYELPFGKDRAMGSSWSGLTQAVLGGWNFSSILNIRSGFPITVFDGRGRGLQPTFAPDRPDRIGDGLASNASWDTWLDIDDFQDAPLGTFGNSGTGVVRGPGYWNWDAGIDKNFSLGGSRRLTLRVEAFNVLNHPAKGLPRNDFSDRVNFGRIEYTANGQRVIEFVGKLSF